MGALPFTFVAVPASDERAGFVHVMTTNGGNELANLSEGQVNALIVDLIDARAKLRPPFPIADDTDEVACPSCGDVGNLRHSEKVDDHRSPYKIDEGVLVVDGESDIDYDGAWDPHLICYACGAEWAVPDEVDWA